MSLKQRDDPNLASVWNVPGGTSSSPTAKLKFRLSAPLRWWKASMLRIVVEEFRTFPLRIRGLLHAPCPRTAVTFQSLCLSGYVRRSADEEYKYQHSCMSHIAQLSRDIDWLGILDQRIAAESFLRGALWASRNLCNSASDESQCH